MKGTMKTARLFKPREPLRIEKIPIPEINVDEVLVDVKACGICGSDLHIIEGITPTAYLPITLGHEISGVLVEIGEKVEEWNKGDRVSISGILNCGICHNCLNGRESVCSRRRVIGIHTDGGFAEFVKVKARNLVPLPQGLSFEMGALVEPIGVPFHAIAQRAKLKTSETVVVYGAGGMGTFALQIAKAYGAAKIIAVDINQPALERSRIFGADELIDAAREDPIARIKELTDGQGVDLAVECVGRKETIANAISSLRIGGRAVVVGLGPEKVEILPSSIFVRNEFELIGSYGYTVGELRRVVDLIASGRLSLSQAISKRMSMDDINEGLKRFKEKTGNPVRILIYPK